MSTASKVFATCGTYPYQVIRSRLLSTTEEMRIALQSVSGSPTVTDASELREAVRMMMAHQSGPMLCNVMLNTHEVLQPKSSAMPQADGSMLSMPLEDMTPLLSLEELRAAMLVPLDEVSIKVRQ